MIKAEELRIGNLVYIPSTKQTIPVTAINMDLGVWVNRSLGVLGFNQVEPIPLSEEWLLKMGFKKYDDEFVSAKFYYGDNPVTHDYLLCLTWIKDYAGTGKLKDFPFYRNGHFRITSVQQLQNLVHSLAGEELTVKN